MACVRLLKHMSITDVLVECFLPKYLVVGYDDEDGYVREQFFESRRNAFNLAETLERVYDYDVQIYDVDLGYEPVWPF